MRKAFLALIFLLDCFSSSVHAAEPQFISMFSLLADPLRYDGQFVRVIAFLHLEFEGNVLYPHKEDYERTIIPNGVWVSLTDQQKINAKKFCNSYVIVEGVFSSKMKGHMGMGSGSLQEINRLEKWQNYRK
jgi:hypothetical protein